MDVSDIAPDIRVVGLRRPTTEDAYEVARETLSSSGGGCAYAERMAGIEPRWEAG